MHKANQAFNSIKLLPIFIMALLMILTVGCQADERDTAVTNEPAIAAAQVPAANPTQDAAQATAEAALAATEMAPSDECLICHIDKERLIRTADPEEVIISENEGEG